MIEKLLIFLFYYHSWWFLIFRNIKLWSLVLDESHRTRISSEKVFYHFLQDPNLQNFSEFLWTKTIGRAKGLVLNKINTDLLQIMRPNKAFYPYICVLCHQNKECLSQKKKKKKKRSLEWLFCMMLCTCVAENGWI